MHKNQEDEFLQPNIAIHVFFWFSLKKKSQAETEKKKEILKNSLQGV